MRRVLGITVLLAGCASGASLGPGQDAPPALDAGTRHDATLDNDALATVDAAPTHDAPAIDAPQQHDAPPAIDAAVAPPDACVPQVTQILLNPAFDLTPAGVSWTETSPQGFALVGANVTPEQSAPFGAFLGGETGFGTVTDFLTQDVVIPAGTTKLELTGFYAVVTSETLGIAFDTADIALTKTDGTPIEDVEPLSNLTTPVGAWTPFDHVVTNIAGLSGTTVRIRMTSTCDDTDETDFFFDTFALTATHGCP